MSRGYGELMGAVRYGYAPYYIVRIDGIPTLLLEVLADAIAPAGFALSPSLVVDSGARVGPVLNPANNLGKGFSFEFRALGGDFDAYFERPTYQTALAGNINAAVTDIPLLAAWQVDGVSPLYLGLETVDNTSPATESGLTGVTRGAYGRARSARTGLEVTDRPSQWIGRKVTVYLVMVDPTAAYVQGADVLSEACALWTGTLAKRPVRDADTWYFTAIDQTARFEKPFSVGASGEVEVTLDDDQLTTIDLNATLEIEVVHEDVSPFGGSPPTVIGVWSFQPFATLTNPVRFSQIRRAISDGWAALTAGDPNVGDLLWEQQTLPSLGFYRRGWRSSLEVTTPSTTGAVRTFTRVWGNTPLFQGPAFAGVPVRSITARYPLQLGFQTNVYRAVLSVVLDSLADEIPSPAGWVRVEGDGISSVVAYSNLTADPLDSQRVSLTLEPSDGLTLLDFATAEVEGEPPELSLTFLWRALGSAPDILRKLIVSSGDGTNGLYDVLGRGQGYSIEHLDAASFDRVFDGVFGGLAFDIVQDAGTSLADIFGDLLRLSGRGVVARRSSDGSEVRVSAINVGSVDGGAPTVTITDADLVDAGREPVRPKSTYDAPQVVEIAVKSSPDGTAARAAQSITLRSPHLSDYTQEAWQLEVYGLSRSALYAAAVVWYLAWARTGENRQVVELDVGPWHDVQPGDQISLDCRDINIWNYATGSRGISSDARVLGAQLSLDRGFQVLTVAVDGIYANRPLCPAMRVLAFDGAATNPTWVEVSGDYYDLCVLCLVVANAQSDGCSVYLPGEDAGRSTFLFNAVSLVSGRTRLTRSLSPSSPTVTLTTAHFLTWRIESMASPRQRAFVHIADRTQWS